MLKIISTEWGPIYALFHLNIEFIMFEHFPQLFQKKSWHFGCFIMKTIWFYTLFLLINKALALCENARHRNSVTFIGKTDFVATSSAFDSLGLLNFRWIFGALVIELDTIVFMTSSYQVFLEIRFGSTLAIF